MEKFMQRENAYNPGYAYAHPQGNSPKASEDLDFNDVFGGPPRRFSTQEVRDRYSFGEAAAADSEEERAAASSPWSVLKEKPVFGEESTPRRSRNQGDDFFDDIFKGGESSSYSSPRRTDRDNVFGSNPGSRVMSPVRPLPPKADPFGTSLSPAQFSLPARLTKAMELPTFGSHNQYKLDGSTNGLNSPHYSCSSPLSRFSNQAIRSQFETRNEVHHQSPLSYDQVSIMSEENSLSTLISDQKDYNAQNSNKETRNVVDNINGNEFHFSIYKWAGRGVPMLMNFVVGNNLKSKDNRRYDKSASSNGRMESKSSTVRKQALSAAEHEALRKQHVEEELRSKGERKELTKALHEFSELNSLQNMKEEQVKPLDESFVREKIEKEVPVKKTESLKSELKPLDAFHGESENPPEMKDKKTRTPEGVHADASNNKTMREKKGVGSDSSTAKVRKSINLGVSQGKSVAKGKVKEFVQIFNQEADSRPKADLERSRGSRWRNVGADQKENYVSSNAAKAKKHVNLHNDGDKKPDISFKVDENPYKDEAQQHSPTKTQSYKTSNNFSTKPQKTFSSEALDRDSKISAENSDDSLEDNFLVQELSDGHENVAESESSESEDIKAIDAKIRQWSVGKKGNIRSLLSTLQYVLWPESGWKPVPLVDLIEANSVKRAYQKALLRLHPDKLQQKGAAFHHKYVAEKVFDILQEAWDHFNTCSIIV